MHASKMTPRERFRRIMCYQPVDRLPVIAVEPYESFGLERWREQGLPQGISPEEFLGMAAILTLPVNLYPIPAFEPTVLYEDADYSVEIDPMGATVRRRKEAPSMYYGFIAHPVKDVHDWQRYKERLSPRSEGRIPSDLEAVAAEVNASDMPVGLQIFPFFFRLGFYLMGMENFMTAFHDQPDLIHDMFSFWSNFVLEVVSPILSRVRIDYACFAEDLAYRSGPHISPATYREFWLPHQDPIVRQFQQHGIPLVCLWTAGNIESLLPTLLEHGINCTWPVERAAGMDPIALRRTCGRDLRMVGAIDKRALIEGPDAVDAELERLMPLIEEGGFIPAVDDMVPPEVSLDTYRHYVEAVRSVVFSR